MKPSKVKSGLGNLRYLDIARYIYKHCNNSKALSLIDEYDAVVTKCV